MHCSRCGFQNDRAAVSCAACGTVLIAGSASQYAVSKKNGYWEQEYRTNPFSSLRITIRDLFLNPVSVFKSIHSSTSLAPALIFGLITGSIGMITGVLWSIILPSSDAASTGWISSIYSSVNSPSLLLLSPLLTIIQIYAAALFMHPALVITGSKSSSFGTTLRVISYSEAAMILQCIPLAGAFIAPLWGLYLIVTGLHVVHQKSKLRVLFSFILLFFILIALFIFIAIAVAVIALLAGSDPGALNILQ